MSKARSVLCQGLTDEQATRVVVLLMSMGIEPTVDADGYGTISVAATEVDDARRLLLEEFPYGFDRTSDHQPHERFMDPQVDAPETWFGRGTGAVVAIIIACTLVYVSASMGPDAGSRTRLLELGAISWSRVEAGQHWRLVAAIFLHFSVAHLASNMVTFLLVAPPLAHIVGPARFLVIFIVAGIGGNVVSHVLSPVVGLKAGASGAIAGVIGALGGQALRPGRRTRFKSWQIIGALLAFYGLLIGFGPGRDNVAHLGGLLVGVALGWLIQPLPSEGRPGVPRAPQHPHP